MAAALRALRRIPAAAPARFLPSSLPGPFPKLSHAASSLPYTRGADSSPALFPSVLRSYCSARQLNSLEQCSDEAAVRFALDKLRDIDKSLTQLKRIKLLKVALLGLFLHAFYTFFFLLNRKVAALGEKVAELESRRIFERKIVQSSDSC